MCAAGLVDPLLDTRRAQEGRVVWGQTRQMEWPGVILRTVHEEFFLPEVGSGLVTCFSRGMSRSVVAHLQVEISKAST